jgi:hypothetical protein
MSAAAIAWLMSALGSLRKALGQAVKLLARYRWQLLCALLAASCALFWRGEHRAQQRYEAATRDIKSMEEASKKAAALAQAQRDADEKRYKELARNADAQFHAAAAQADRATAGYIALHRVHTPADQGPGSAAAGQPDSGGPGVPAPAAAEAELVAVSDADVNTCAQDYSYARAAYEWASAPAR